MLGEQNRPWKTGWREGGHFCGRGHGLGTAGGPLLTGEWPGQAHSCYGRKGWECLPFVAHDLQQQ